MNGTYVIPVADEISEYSIMFDEPNDGLVIAATVLMIYKDQLPERYRRDRNAHLGATEKET
jgi:hypothetical protein